MAESPLGGSLGKTICLSVDVAPRFMNQGYRKPEWTAHRMASNIPTYMFRLHKDARRFLARYRATLAERPVAIFALGPFNDEEKEWQGVHAQLDKELAEFSWFVPVSKQVFGGKFDPSKLRFPYNLVPALKRLPVSDIRDWKAIHDWATGVAEKLQRA